MNSYKKNQNRICSGLYDESYCKGKPDFFQDVREKIFAYNRKGVNFFKGLLFVLLLFAGLKISVKLLYPSNLIVRIWDGFYSLKRESLDLLVTGSSHAFSTFDPSIILEETGMENYILASQSDHHGSLWD